MLILGNRLLAQRQGPWYVPFLLKWARDGEGFRNLAISLAHQLSFLSRLLTVDPPSVIADAGFVT